MKRFLKSAAALAGIILLAVHKEKKIQRWIENDGR